MEPNNIFGIFFSLENPAIYASIFTLSLFVLLFLIKNEFIRPLSEKKNKLELENVKLSALYSEIDPDPIIRIDNNWIVTDMNNAAQKLFNSDTELVKNAIVQIKTRVESKKEISLVKIENKNYSIHLEKIEELSFSHIYLHGITDRIEFEKKIKNYQENLKELRTKVDKVNEEEKQRIGKELHDSVGNGLSILRIEFQNLMNKKHLNIEEKETSELFNSIDQLTNEVRGLSQELRPRILEEFGLIQAIKSIVDKVNQQDEMKGFVYQNKNFRIDEKNIELNIYRICQEAINNIVRHSNCSEFYFDFCLNQNILNITISDDGEGFNLNEQFNNKRSSLGLLNMKERIESVSGTFRIDSMLSMGTMISLELKIIEVVDD